MLGLVKNGLTRSLQSGILLVTATLFSLGYSPKSLADAPNIDISRINNPNIKVDGDLSEAAWQNAIVVDINNITFPQENQPASVSTKAMLFEDGETLYVSFIAQDPDPQAIRAFLRDRDSDHIWNDDLIGIKIDTYADAKLAYQFWVNPLGVQVDSIENVVSGQESSAWDAIWDSAGQITEQGYVVEMALPLRILNFNDLLNSQQWTVELVRFYPRDSRQRISNMTLDTNNNCKVCQMGLLRGFSGAKQGKSLAVVPSLTVGVNESREADEGVMSDWSRQTNADIGLDIKWGITPDMSLNATINPDFSQIEADAGQLSINNTFSLFFPEKRAFFLDNIDYFATPYNLVYTRNISSPDYGAKLTGRINAHSFGLFTANDTATNLFIPGNLGSDTVSLEQESQNAVLRYRYDPSNMLSLGWIATLRKNDDNYHNYVNGLDIKYKITDNDDFTAQVLYSDTEYSASLHQEFFEQDDNDACEINNCEYDELTLRTNKIGKFSDTAYYVRYRHDERDWDFVALYKQIGDDYRADLGFNNVVDWSKFVVGGNRIWRGDDNNWWERIRFGGDWDITHNEHGEILEKEAQLALNIDAQNQSNIYIGVTERERVGSRHREYDLAINGNTTMYNESQLNTYWSTKIGGNLSLSTNIDFGDEIDFANDRLGKSLYVRPTLTWNPNKHITVRSRLTYKALEAQGADVFTAKLWDTRFTYQFSVRSFIRLAIIYSDIERNQANYLDEITENDRSISSQLLYSYKINPQTLFFVGYSDSAYADDEINEMTGDNKTVFMKFSYAWLR